jgi:hypothetical protein
VCVVCYSVEVSASGRSLVQRNYTERGVFDCDLEISKMRRPTPQLGLYAEIKIAFNKAYICSRLIYGIAGSNTDEDMDVRCLSLLYVV